MHSGVPPYVYKDNDADNSLSQGDILKVDGDFRDKFIKFYPTIKHPEGETKYVLVLTQSCDLVRTGKRKPKLHHINLCLVRTLDDALKRIIDDDIKPPIIDGAYLLPRAAMDKLKDRLSKLLNNNDQKIHFFLPKKSPFEKDMVALLHMSFSFRTEENYDLLLQNRVLSLKSEFQAKLGHIISQLYGRIATPDLTDNGWNNLSLRDYIDKVLMDTNLRQLPDEHFITYVRENWQKGDDIDVLTQEFQAQKIEKNFEPRKKELLQDIKSRLRKFFKESDDLEKFKTMEEKELSQEIEKIIRPTN